MNVRNNGGPAYPQPISYMTLRDYFAAKAIQGFCANPHHGAIDFNPEWEGYDGGTPEEFQQAVREAYLMADAMLKAREES